MSSDTGRWSSTRSTLSAAPRAAIGAQKTTRSLGKSRSQKNRDHTILARGKTRTSEIKISSSRQTKLLEFGTYSTRRRAALSTRTNLTHLATPASVATDLPVQAPSSPETPPRPSRGYAEIMEALKWHCTLRTPEAKMACDAAGKSISIPIWPHYVTGSLFTSR